jgi:POT family proton-dependent oligopeptide transporter
MDNTKSGATPFDSALNAELDRSFFGHPRGLGVLAFTEAWERFSFSGMQALLVLYMVGRLLHPGHVEHVLGFGPFSHVLQAVYGPMSAQPLSSVIFGLYSSLVFFLPVFGGVLGDRVFGQHRMVMAGATLMALGHFTMAFEQSFLIALLLLILGAGCLKGNISTQVGALYADDDRRRTDAFQIFSVATNVGIIAAPLVCGTLGEVYGWDYGFGVAGVGMLVGLVIYIAGTRSLPPDRKPANVEKARSLKPEDPRMIFVLVAVFMITTAFLAAAGQLGNVYILWLKAGVDRRAFGLEVPVTWFLMVTPLFSALITPMFLEIWGRQAARGREPRLMTKMGQGMAMATVAIFWLALLAGCGQRSGHPVYWLWLLPMHLLISAAYLFVYPVGLALFSRAAPQGGRAMFIGIFFLSSFVAGNLVGWSGRFYSVLPAPTFWLYQAGIGVAGAALAFVLARPISRILAAVAHDVSEGRPVA